jgi:hypothetical protein
MALISLGSLCFGTVVYILSRSDAYISKGFIQLMNIKNSFNILPVSLSFYLPDFLWAMALCSCLFAVCPMNAYRGFIWGIITFLYGAGWEILQLFKVVSGTADIIDVLLYLIAAVAVVMINLYFKEEERK